MMIQIEDILSDFHNPNGYFPKEAVNTALSQQEAITPHLLSILEKTLSQFELVEDYQMDHLFALYLLSKFREKRAFPYVLAFASLPDEWLDALLGDCITEAWARFIVSTFNDDLGAIKKIIEDPMLDEWTRNAALNSLLGLVAIGKLERDELIDYIRMLLHSSLSDDEDFMTHLIDVASVLYPEELIEEINAAFEENKVDTFGISKTDVDHMLALDKKECLEKYVYNGHFHLPIDNVEQDMIWMSAFEKSTGKKQLMPAPRHSIPNEYYDDPSRIETPATYIRETPKIGRNDQCYCGSGRKFKKCCLN